MPSANLPSSKLRFICDEQLGRLAKWLRLQGFDTLFECPVEDSKLIRLAQTESRVLLTRDHHLPAKTLWEAVVVLEKSHYADQLGELKKKIKLPEGNPFSRCLECNEPIQSIEKSQVKKQVPQQVYETYENFYTCPYCQKIYWQGSHVQASKARLARMRR